MQEIFKKPFATTISHSNVKFPHKWGRGKNVVFSMLFAIQIFLNCDGHGYFTTMCNTRNCRVSKLSYL